MIGKGFYRKSVKSSFKQFITTRTRVGSTNGWITSLNAEILKFYFSTITGNFAKFRPSVAEAHPFWSEASTALSSQASSCLRVGHGTDVDNTVEWAFSSSSLPLLKMGSLGWIVQCFTSPPTQYRLYGRRFLQVKRPNQQYQTTEGKSTKENNPENKENTKYTCIHTKRVRQIQHTIITQQVP